MKGTALVLQGDSKFMLIFDEKTRPAEMGEFGQRLEAQVASGKPVTLLGGISAILDNRPSLSEALEEKVTRDKSSGRYHRRYTETIGDKVRTLVDERCQADQSGRYEVLVAIPESATDNELCAYCWAPVAHG